MLVKAGQGQQYFELPTSFLKRIWYNNKTGTRRNLPENFEKFYCCCLGQIEIKYKKAKILLKENEQEEEKENIAKKDDLLFLTIKKDECHLHKIVARITRIL